MATAGIIPVQKAETQAAVWASIPPDSVTVDGADGWLVAPAADEAATEEAATDDAGDEATDEADTADDTADDAADETADDAAGDAAVGLLAAPCAELVPAAAETGLDAPEPGVLDEPVEPVLLLQAAIASAATTAIAVANPVRLMRWFLLFGDGSPPRRRSAQPRRSPRCESV